MRKNRILSLMLVFGLLSTLYIGASEYPYDDSGLEYNGAPIVYVEDDSELPQAMRDNIEKCKNEPYISIEKERSFNEWLNRTSGRIGEITPYWITRPALITVLQYPQDTDYYCGYAALQSILGSYNIALAQAEIAADAYNANAALAWFSGNNAQATDWRRYPAAAYLDSLPEIDHEYRPYNSWFGTFNASVLVEKIKYDIDEAEVGVLVCGISRAGANSESRLPNYPIDQNIGHWIVVNGYCWDTDTQSVSGICYADPAKSEAVSWSDAISEYAETDPERMFKFASGNGIIW